MLSLGLSDFALRRAPKNRAHLSRVIPGYTDVVQTNLPRAFYAQGLEALKESPLIALEQLLLQTLGAFSRNLAYAASQTL